MASSDWSALTDGIGSSTLVRGVTQGLAVPNGGGSYVYAYNMTVGGTIGAAGLYYTAVNFNPMSNGGRISCAMKRLPSGSNTGFAPMIFMSLQSNSVNGTGYLLGLQDDDPSYIALRKGAPSSGLYAGPADAPTGSLLQRSVDDISNDEWVHLQLEVEVTGTGDVLIRCQRNDLTANSVSAPVWEDISGMDEFVDDVAQINTGSAPLVGGRAGFAFYTEDITRRGAFDHLVVARQL